MEIQNSIVAILDRKKKIIGTGFVAGENLILTCAHVTETATSNFVDPTTTDLNVEVTIRFAVDGSEVIAQVDAQNCSPSYERDVATLRVDTLPPGVKPLPLAPAAGSAGHDFYAYGYATVIDIQGIGARGQIVDIVENGHLVQLTSQEPDHGMSGGPVFDERRRVVIGMVRKGKGIVGKDNSLRNIYTTFATSTDVIFEVCHNLKPTEICPYRGLASFSEEDAPLFFGRDRVIRKLLESLKKQPRFLAVLGPSGSGKSSVVRAGLVPALKAGKLSGSSKWEIMTLRPANQPFEQLKAAGLGDLQVSIENSARSWLASHPEKTRLVLLIDQFEEIFVSTEADVRQKFINELGQLLDSRLDITVILCLRDDFYSRFAQDATKIVASFLNGGLANIPLTLAEDELRDMVFKPADSLGLTFDEGLVDLIIQDACAADQTEGEARSTILPLLEFALTQLWEMRVDGLLTHEAYQTNGRIAGSLSQWADHAYHQLDGNEQKIAEHIFCSLVHLGDEKQHIPDVRRMMQIGEIETLLHKEVTKSVIYKLVQWRLLSVHKEAQTDDEYIEIIHDAMLRQWGQLVIWIDHYRRREQIARERNRLFIMLGLALIAIVMIALAINANHQAQVALARQMVAQAEYTNVTRGSKQLLAELLAIRSMQILPSAEAAQVLLDSTEARELLHINLGADVTSVAFSPDGKYVLAASGSNVVVLEVAGGRQVARLQHDDLVYTAAFSPNGKYLVSGSRDQAVSVWEVASGKLLQKLPLDGNVYAVAFSPDSNYVAGGGDQFARVWKVLTWTKISRMRINNGPVFALAFSSDGEYLATGDSRLARVWNVSTSVERSRINHSKAVRALAFSPDGKTVASGGDGFNVLIWDAANGRKIAESWHAGAVTGVAFSSDGAYVISGSRDNTARVWDAHSGGEVARMTHDGSVFAVGLSPAGSTTGFVLSAGADFTARVWDAGDGHEIARMSHDGFVSAAAFSPDGKYVVSGGSDHTLRVWAVAGGLERARMTHINRVYTAAFSPDGKYVLSGSADKSLRIWDAATGAEKVSVTHDDTIFSAVFSKDGKTVISGGGHNLVITDVTSGRELARIPQEGQIYTVAVSPDGQYAATGSSDGTARVWDIRTGKEVARMTHGAKLQIVLFSPLDGGKYVLSGSADQTARVWDALSGREIIRVPHKDEVYSAAFSPDGKYIVSGDTGSARVWEVLTGRMMASVTHTNFVYGVAFSPDGKYVVSGGGHEVKVWEALTGNVLAVMSHDGVVNAVAFSPNGQYVLSGDDKGAHVWEAMSGRELARMTHDNLVKTVSFSPDGNFVLSGGVDKTARIWPWQSQDLVAGACASVPRNMTRDEWKFYLGDEPYQVICPGLPMAPEPRETLAP